MTDFDTTNEGAHTAPLPIAEEATVPTVPLPPTGAAAAVSATPDHRPWRPSTGGIVALALAGAFAVSAISFGAGWGAHGIANRFAARHAFVMGASSGSASFGNGFDRGVEDGQGSPAYDERGWNEGGQGLGDGGPGGSYGGRGRGFSGGCPGQNR